MKRIIIFSISALLLSFATYFIYKAYSIKYVNHYFPEGYNGYLYYVLYKNGPITDIDTKTINVYYDSLGIFYTGNYIPLPFANTKIDESKWFSEHNIKHKFYCVDKNGIVTREVKSLIFDYDHRYYVDCYLGGREYSNIWVHILKLETTLMTEDNAIKERTKIDKIICPTAWIKQWGEDKWTPYIKQTYPDWYK